MEAANETAMAEDYKVHKGRATALFVFGTKDVDWLDIWRGSNAEKYTHTTGLPDV